MYFSLDFICISAAFWCILFCLFPVGLLQFKMNIFLLLPAITQTKPDQSRGKEEKSKRRKRSKREKGEKGEKGEKEKREKKEKKEKREKKEKKEEK